MPHEQGTSNRSSGFIAKESFLVRAEKSAVTGRRRLIFHWQPSGFAAPVHDVVICLCAAGMCLRFGFILIVRVSVEAIKYFANSISEIINCFETRH